ncbi:butyrophilin subfamily 1 member A1 isoform X2 [Sciurus carolinensis]|uniref:butyrophilin subfamily 1 member A1 isoform X2 n=1 Tax=Sciurus carolinensis TaxID=30640 RepID=UPI001FB215D9|nr:butyrophilin subfamily 1 member A1 isoform X2 [Sciurus carolinensis]XP_047413871.1 butyrophilin subfamily 1 member A1 isoform X2 [Sciurus carolinensis]XP_047413872.1 butyrophilin subfamily 1 member A1 isoform X2 [Sciurus carolinensis]XP_047413873.1 butyrophilin subfamily 1 member A1 isoform X2 [Sciurus carolinensis]
MAVFRKSCLPRCLLTLALLQLPTLDSARFDVIGPAEPVLAVVGADAELPCHLSPNVSAEHMELRWFRRTRSPAVLLYPAPPERERERELMPEFRGRVTLVRDHLAAGRAALRICGVRAADEGEYRCFFRDNANYDEATVHLRVAALGSDPHITVEIQESGAVRLECSSMGWYPEPQVQWRTTKGETFLSTAESRSPGDKGLFTVAASVTLRDNSTDSVFCSIRNLLLDQEKEVGISIPAPVPLRLNPWMVAVAVILVVLGLLTVGSMVFIWKLYKERSRERKSKFSSKERLLEELKWKKAALHAVNVTLDPDTAHPHLFLYEDAKSVQLEDSRQKLPENPERFDSWPCVLGREAFTQGRHYWEVEVGDRTDWAIGVCRENVRKKGFDPMTSDNGFWAVELYGNGYWALTPLRTPLPLAGPPRRVGVFLDCEAGDISFYSMTDGSHIYTFPSLSFSGPLRPFFCLWSSGKKPLTICPVTERPAGVAVISEAQDLSKDIPLSRVGEDCASGDTDTPRSKLIPAQPSQGLGAE